jgi:hypothetical protein
MPELSMLGRLTRLVWAALDGIDYVITGTRPRLFDLIYGPELPSRTDEDQEQFLCTDLAPLRLLTRSRSKIGTTYIRRDPARCSTLST